jgi:hypothetical protein
MFDLTPFTSRYCGPTPPGAIARWDQLTDERHGEYSEVIRARFAGTSQFCRLDVGAEWDMALFKKRTGAEI